MEDSETTIPVSTAPNIDSVDNDRSEFVNSGRVRESEIDSVLAAVQQTAKSMQLVHTNSHKQQQSPKFSVLESQVEAESGIDSIPETESSKDSGPRIEKRTNVGALTAKFEKVASAGKLATPASSSKQRVNNHQGSPHSPSAMSDASSSESSPVDSSIKRSSSDSGDTLLSKHNRTPSTRSAGQAESKRVTTSSTGIASKINSFIADRRGTKGKSSPFMERENIALETVDAAVSSEEAQPQETLPMTNTAATEKEVSAVAYPSAMMIKKKQESIASSIGSDVMSSGDYSTTDVDSSLDFMSPLTSPASSLGASSIHDARKAAVKRARENNVKRTTFKVEWEEEEDKLGELTNTTQMSMRLRTKTLSYSTGVSSRTTVEPGRINERTRRAMKEKQFAHKRHHSLTDLRLIRGEFTKELELISPDFESKIRERIQRGVSKKYGGLEKANEAAIKIQHCWRQYKLRSRFQKIKQQNKSQLQLQMRKRAQSMRDPRRRPSIMKKRNKAYNRETSVAHISSKHQATMLDLSPRQERRAFAHITKTRISPTEKVGEKLEEGDEEEMPEVQERCEVSQLNVYMVLSVCCVWPTISSHVCGLLLS